MVNKKNGQIYVLTVLCDYLFELNCVGFIREVIQTHAQFKRIFTHSQNYNNFPAYYFSVSDQFVKVRYDPISGLQPVAF